MYGSASFFFYKHQLIAQYKLPKYSENSADENLNRVRHEENMISIDQCP